jgi:hypothetical protein
LLYHRLEFVIDEINRIQFTGRELCHQQACNLLCLRVIQLVEDIDELMCYRYGPLAEEISSLAPDTVQGKLLLPALVYKSLGSFDDVGVESATESPVRSDDDQLNVVITALLQKRMCLSLGARDQAVEHR